jgi:hypothetical protein
MLLRRLFPRWCAGICAAFWASFGAARRSDPIRVGELEEVAAPEEASDGSDTVPAATKVISSGMSILFASPA